MLQALLCLVCAIGLDSDSDTDPNDLSPVTEEIAEILTKWEAASGEAKKCKIEFHRTVYNMVFQTDSRSEGELFWQMPYEVRWIVRPAPLPKKPVVRGGPNAPFRIEPGQAEQWIWSATHVVITHDSEKSFLSCAIEKNDRPLPKLGEVDADYCSELFEGEQSQSWADRIRIAFSTMRHADFMYPFLLAIKTDKLRSLWSFKILKRDADRVFLVATPRTRFLKQCYSECRVILDTTTWQISAVKTYDPSRNVEVIYTIKDRKLNPELPADTFSPDLKSLGYRGCSIEDTSKQSPAKQLID